MRTYEPPELVLHGSVEQLTGIVGNTNIGDELVVNGSTVATQDKGNQTSSASCSFFDSGGDGTFTFLGNINNTDECQDAFEDWQNGDPID